MEKKPTKVLLFMVSCMFALLLLLLVCAQTNAQERTKTLEEASGITRQGDYLLIVGDGDPGAYYKFPLSRNQGPEIPIDPGRATRVALPKASLALDLEAIDVLADDRIVVLSERLRALLGKNGVIADYDNPLSDFGNRGLEGLAVRRLRDGSSRVAVLWEGGYPEYKDVPAQLQTHVGRLPLRPVVWVHDLKAGEAGTEVKSKNAVQVIELEVPKLGGREPQAQRFRAPDLVWHKQRGNAWGFIVLLSSQTSPKEGNPEYVHMWLQRFRADGRPLGKPLDLKAIIPAQLKGANWEGLGWFEEGKSLVLIHDKPPKGPPTAFVVNLPDDWK